MNILVTGGAGFIGSNLVHYLTGLTKRENPLDVTRVITLDSLTYAGNVANLKPVEDDPRHHLVTADIADANRIAHILREFNIDAIMHLAAESHVDRSIDEPGEFVTTNVIGTFTLLDEFRRWVSESKRDQHPNYGRPLAEGGNCAFLHVSTDEVYGSLSPSDPPFCETTPYSPNSPYSASKAASDHLARAWFHTYGLPVITTNCSNNYGPYQFPEKLLPLMIQKALNNEPLPVYGDGSNVRDWLYVSDHCHGLALALARGSAGETYTIGGRAEKTNLEVVQKIILTLQKLAPERNIKAPEELITFVKDRPGHDRRYAIDPSRIERELGWEVQESFESGLEQTISWYLNNKDWVHAIEDQSYRGERLGTLSPSH